MTDPGEVRRRAREVALWIGAGLGVLCLLLTALAWIFDVRPLVFRSGSMSPEIGAGALALAREVPADELRQGDVVSVVTADGTRLTHRIVDIAPDGPRATLTLQGDANRLPDAETYPVDSAYRVFFDVPGLGRVVQAASTPWGLLLCGGFVAMLLVTAFGGRRGDHPWRGAAGAVSIALVVTGGAVLAPRDTMAAWSDTAAVTGRSHTALTVAPPTSPACKTNGILLTTATVSWASAGANRSYLLVVHDTAGTELRRDTVTGTSLTYEISLFGTLLSRNAVVTIRAFPTGVPSWVSSGSVTANLRIKTLGLGVECR